MNRWCTVALAAIGVSACADGPALDKGQLEDARRAYDRKDVEVRAYQWQLANLTQQLQAGQQRSDGMQRELFAQVQHLTAENAALSERLKRAESDRAALGSVPVDNGKAPRDGTEALRRAIASSDAQNSRVADELARIAKILSSQRPAAEAASPRAPIDVVDPWGFGSRK